MTQLFRNNAVSALVGAIADGDTVFDVANGTLFPTPAVGEFFLLTLIRHDVNGNEVSWEIVKVTARSGSTVTVVRAQEGTTAQDWPDGTIVEARVTAGSLAELKAADASKLGGRTAAEFWHTGNLVKQTSPTDTTAGALMAAGAFGLGAGALSSNGLDFDTPTATGWYYAANSVNSPVPGTTFALEHVQMTSARAQQVAYRIGANETYARFKNTTWGPWVRQVDTGNLLGTVSLSGGVPTGAAFQSVVNANGRALIFPDGTAICFKLATASFTGNSAFLDTGLLDWPVNFASTNELSVGESLGVIPSGVAGSAIAYCRVDKTASTIRAYVYAAANVAGFSSGNSMEVRFTAMGKVAI